LRKKVLFIVFLVLMVYEQICNGGDFIFSIKKDWFCVLCSFLQKIFFEWGINRIKILYLLSASPSLRSLLNTSSLPKTTMKATKLGLNSACLYQEKIQNKINHERSDEYGCNVSFFFFRILVFRKEYTEF